MNHGSLFSGIGGFDLAAEWMCWNNIFHCEWNEFGKKVLHHYWPDAIQYHDITKTDFTIHRGRIDILTGGFPYQPYSSAGKRLGKDDERHLWPEMLRAIREIQPRWIVGENVLGLTNWNGGLVFHEVQTDLEAAGYEVQPFILPAAAVNAPHRRDRVWFVAHAVHNGALRGSRKDESESGEKRLQERDKVQRATQSSGLRGDATHAHEFRLEHTKEGGNIYCSTRKAQGQRSEPTEPTQANGGNGDATNADLSRREREREQPVTEREERAICISGQRDATHPCDERLQGSKLNRGPEEPREIKGQGGLFDRSIRSEWQEFPTQSPICGGDDGLPRELDGITFPKWRAESIKAYGNAVVPQVVFQIFKAIEQYETL